MNNLLLCPIPQNIKYNTGKYLELTKLKLNFTCNNNIYYQNIFEQELKLINDLIINNDESKELIELKLNIIELSDNSYSININQENVFIESNNYQGIFYALMTLKQIIRQSNKDTIACLSIEDYPDFEDRGVMIDISRDKVPTMDTLFYLIDIFSEFKFNQLQLYTEHTFAYDNHKTVWEKSSPMTSEEIKELDKYCKNKFIDLVPNQNTFGHMSRWLKHDDYKHLSECPNGFRHPFGEWRPDPSVLSPKEEGSLLLVEEIISELIPNFTSKYFNIGCDETFELGQGKSKKDCEKNGIGKVYLDYLLKVYYIVKNKDKTMQFWGDIITEHPELINKLPKDIVALQWGYEFDHPFNSDSKKFKEAGIPFYVCPGTSSWNSLTSRTKNAMENILNAAKNGKDNNAKGFLVTDWGDNGHWQNLPFSFISFLYSSAVSWSVEKNKNIDITKVVDLHIFNNHSGLGEILFDLGNIYLKTNALIHNSTSLFQVLFKPELSFEDNKLENLSKESINETVKSLKKIELKLTDSEKSLVYKEVKNTIRLLLHSCQLILLRLETEDGSINSINYKSRQVLSKDIVTIIDEYKYLWLKRNRIGGLEDSIKGFNLLLNIYNRK